MENIKYLSTDITAGKWLMNSTKRFINNPGGLAITSESGVVVASVNHDLHDKSLVEYTANACAIAAVPEMIEALKKIYVSLEGINDTITNDIMSIALNALKAAGRHAFTSGLILDAKNVKY